MYRSLTFLSSHVFWFFPSLYFHSFQPCLFLCSHSHYRWKDCLVSGLYHGQDKVDRDSKLIRRLRMYFWPQTIQCLTRWKGKKRIYVRERYKWKVKTAYTVCQQSIGSFFSLFCFVLSKVTYSTLITTISPKVKCLCQGHNGGINCPLHAPINPPKIQ